MIKEQEIRGLGNSLTEPVMNQVRDWKESMASRFAKWVKDGRWITRV